MAKLLDDCLAESPAAAPFYAGFSSDLPGIRIGNAAWDPAFLEELRAYQGYLGLERNIPDDAHVVITGQQPGLLTGPLYSIYKAITAIGLARKLESAWGKKVVPVFWVGADDHDFEEARQTHILSRTHQSCGLRYEPEGDVANLALYRMPLDSSLHGLIDAAAAAAPGSELGDEVSAWLHQSLEEASDYADWFARTLARLFRDTDLVFFTTPLSTARKLAAPIMAQEIDAPLASTQCLLETTRRLEAAGFQGQVQKAPNECNFFLEVDERRRKVSYEQGHFVLPETGMKFSPSELHAILEAEPERFSPNVVLRPVVQQRLFPVCAYVGGPGEVAYWGQFKDVFALFNTPMPVVYPRAGARLSTLKLNKLLTRYGFDFEALEQPKDLLLERALRMSVRSAAQDAFAGNRGAVEEAATLLAQAVAGAAGKDEALKDGATAFSHQISQALDRMERLILRKDEAQVGAVRQQVERLVTAFFPDKKAQERHYSIFSFLFEQGWDLIPRLLDEMDIGPNAMNEIEL